MNGPSAAHINEGGRKKGEEARAGDTENRLPESRVGVAHACICMRARRGYVVSRHAAAGEGVFPSFRRARKKREARGRLIRPPEPIGRRDCGRRLISAEGPVLFFVAGPPLSEWRLTGRGSV